MLNKKFLIQPTVDVFISSPDVEDSDKVLITFNRITTRERIEIITSKSVVEILSKLDGEKSLNDVITEVGSFSLKEAVNLFNFLTNNHLVTDINLIEISEPRYSRQTTYFDDMIFDRDGQSTQEILKSKGVVLFGCGAVGSQIIEVLVRAGISKCTLVDYKKVGKSNLTTHLYTRLKDIGRLKVDCLKDYLLRINSNLEVKTFNDKLLPHTDISSWLDDSKLVINSFDEPYIGHTSLKIGRYLHTINLPLYIVGGFDAHLMSSGEMIFPPITPCIDCAQNTFSLALSDWKPVYKQTKVNQNVIENNIMVATDDLSMESEDRKLYMAGGPGGVIMMSGFSANLSAISILRFLAEDSAYELKSIRYEYLPNRGTFTEFKMNKQDKCNVCHS